MAGVVDAGKDGSWEYGGRAKGRPNPAECFFGAGVDGKGVVPTRDLDRFGLGFYYIIMDNPTFQGPFRNRSLLRDEWGFEAFYNVALTPWMLLRPDLQVIGPAQKRRVTGPLTRGSMNTAVVLGMQLQLVF